MDQDDERGLAGLPDRLDLEAASALVTGEPVVVDGRRGLDGADGDELARRVRELPAVTVLVGSPAGVPEVVADAFDVCVTDEDGDLARPWVRATPEPIVAAVADQPLASLALVTCLRSTGSAWERIAAEASTFAMLLGSAAFHRWRAEHVARTRPEATGASVRVVRDGPILDVALDRIEARNAIDSAVRDELVAALDVALGDPSIAEVHLRGRGPCFSAGGDLDEFGTVGDPATSFAVRLTRHPGRAVHEVADRVVAHLHGACIGAGIEIPAFAARVVAAPDTEIRLPELAMGLIPGAGGTVSLPDRIGRQRTAWLALTGASIDAATAHAWGLVDEVVSAEAAT